MVGSSSSSSSSSRSSSSSSSSSGAPRSKSLVQACKQGCFVEVL